MDVAEAAGTPVARRLHRLGHAAAEAALAWLCARDALAPADPLARVRYSRTACGVVGHHMAVISFGQWRYVSPND